MSAPADDEASQAAILEQLAFLTQAVGILCLLQHGFRLPGPLLAELAMQCGICLHDGDTTVQ